MSVNTLPRIGFQARKSYLLAYVMLVGAGGDDLVDPLLLIRGLFDVEEKFLVGAGRKRTVFFFFEYLCGINTFFVAHGIRK